MSRNQRPSLPPREGLEAALSNIAAEATQQQKLLPPVESIADLSLTQYSGKTQSSNESIPTIYISHEDPPTVNYFEVYTQHPFFNRLSLLDQDTLERFFATAPHHLNNHHPNPLGSRVFDGFLYQTDDFHLPTPRPSTLNETVMHSADNLQWKTCELPLAYLKFLYLHEIIEITEVTEITEITEIACLEDPEPAIRIVFTDNLDSLVNHFIWKAIFNNETEARNFLTYTKKLFKKNSSVEFESTHLNQPGILNINQSSHPTFELKVLSLNDRQIFLHHTCLCAGVYSFETTNITATNISTAGHLNETKNLTFAQKEEFISNPDKHRMIFDFKKITVFTSTGIRKYWRNTDALIRLAYLSVQENVRLNLNPYWLKQFYELFENPIESRLHPLNEKTQRHTRNRLRSVFTPRSFEWTLPVESIIEKKIHHASAAHPDFKKHHPNLNKLFKPPRSKSRSENNSPVKKSSKRPKASQLKKSHSLPPPTSSQLSEASTNKYDGLIFSQRTPSSHASPNNTFIQVTTPQTFESPTLTPGEENSTISFPQQSPSASSSSHRDQPKRRKRNNKIHSSHNADPSNDTNTSCKMGCTIL